ncbi:SUMF1/EgtB/PvdO family nonheme iron enzyme [Cohnella sp. AR92]|uniref:formylglycine-generating enzyme family protein n=1 Tax=Cohnella sp. AR92 TaxID=648716 RepID=UPI000F8C97B7|nr:SUMF1/EgtB/PvdO family nonheme iron enzyme [Cohnella sp. AR92]RUS43315.1 formylglycine-generating enzyme family protein [Cohnella sp. AR92]
MRKVTIFILIAMTALLSACSQERANPKAEAAEKKPEQPDNLVFVEGGPFTNKTSNFFGKSVTLSNFYIGKYEVTQKEWLDVMGNNPSVIKGGNQPVEMVSWYDAIEYCNERSLKEGLEPYYDVNRNKTDPNNKSDNDNLKWTVTIREGANGYRLPTEAEWEYAASGGTLSKNYPYSGSDDANEVAWYWRNSGDQFLSGDWSWPAIENNRGGTKAVGTKSPNELGLYDMSGNVREWCWDWYKDADSESGIFRVVKGGGWIGDVSNDEVSFRGKFEANGYGPDQGFRVVRGE